MPYLKPQKQPFDKLHRLLLGYGLNGENLSAALSCSATTARKRISEPGTISLKELSQISRKYHIPIDEIRESISW